MTFYSVSPTTVLLNLIIDSVVAYISFRLTRPLNSTQMILYKRTKPTANHYILKSTTIKLYTVILSASIYAVTIFTAYQTWLPSFLITYFNNIQNITTAQSPFYITQFPVTIFLGVAAESFLFTPAIATESICKAKFDAKTASFWETLWYNIWGYSSRTKMVIKRTSLLVIVTSLNTLTQICVAIEGVEFLGAVAYTTMWIAAFAINGLAFVYIAAA